MENYGEHFHMNIDMVDASQRFYQKLAYVSDPEENAQNHHQRICVSF